MNENPNVNTNPAGTPAADAQSASNSQSAADMHAASAADQTTQQLSSTQSAQSSYAPPSGAPVKAGSYAPARSLFEVNSSTSSESASSASNPTRSAYQPIGKANAASSHAAASAKGSSSGKIFLIAFAGALVACVLAFGIALGLGLRPFGGGATLGATTSSTIEAVEEETTLAEAVADKCLPSVVSINVLSSQSSGTGNSIYDLLYGYGYGQEDGGLTETGLGSGVILSDDGYIVTNYHVIDGGEQFRVTIEGDEYEAELVGSETSSDIAVLKVKDGSGFQAIEIGDSDEIRVGEWVMSLGSPFGLEQSVATGIISATSRSQIMESEPSIYGGSGEATIYPNMIQTDAAINPGNSGGALVDDDGKLIGINTLISSYSGSYSGVGFAIPSNYAISLAQSLIAGEEPTHAQLGITMTTVNAQIAQRYGFKADSGAYVSGVAEGGAAANAGMQVGDIITAFDGKKVTSASDVMLDVRTQNPGDTVTVTVNRDGETKDLQVTLGETKSESTQQQQQQQQQQNGGGQGQGGNGYGSQGNILDLFN